MKREGAKDRRPSRAILGTIARSAAVLWTRLTEPARAVREPAQRRRAQLLSSLLVPLLPVATAVFIVRFLVDFAFQPSPVAVGGIVVLLLLYALSRSRYYRLAALLVVSLFPAIILTMILSRYNPIDFQNLVPYLALGILLSSVLLTARTTVLLAIVNVGGLLLLLLFVPDVTVVTLIPSLTFLTLLSALAVVAMQHRNLLEMDRQADLRQLKEFNEGIVQSMAEGIAVEDATGYFTFINPAAADLLGYQVWELIGRHWTDVVPPDQQAIVRDADGRREGGASDRYELVLVRKDGTRLPVLVSGSPRFDPGSGQFAGTLAVFTDISERLQAEGALRGRTEQLEALHQVGLEIAAQLDLDALLHSIVSRAAELVGGVIGGFYLYRPDREVLEVVVAVGVEPGVIGLTLGPGEGVAGRVWQSAEPLLVPDYRHWEGRAAMYEDQDFRATVGVPVRWGDEFLGVLDVSANVPGAFSSSDAELLNLFATQAAIAIQNARLFQDAQQRLGELSLLFETSAAISSSLDADAVLQAAAQQATTALAVDGCAISIWDRAQDALVTLLDYSPDPELWQPEATGAVYPLAAYPASRRVLAERRPLVVLAGEAGADEGEVGWMAAQEVLSLLMVPLVVRDQAIGLLELMDIHRPREFTPSEIRLCQTLANQAAAALENARLFQAEREQHELAEVLREAAQVVSAIAQALNATTDLASVFQVVARHLARIVAFDRLSVALLGDGDGQFTMYALAVQEGAPLAAPLAAGVTLPLAATAAAADILAGRPHLTPDLEAELDYAADRALYQSGLRSRLNLPLRLGETVIGTLNLASYQPGAFLPEQLPLLTQVADAVAAAVQNARLYEETVRRNRELALLNRVIAASAAGQAIETILETVCRELAQVFDLPQSVAGLLTKNRTEAMVVAEYQTGDWAPLRNRVVPVTGIPAFRALLEQKAPLVVDDAQRDPQLARLYDMVRSRGVVSLLLLPLVVEGRVLGGLLLGATEPRSFPLDKVNLAQRVAEQVSGSLARTRLEEERLRLAEQVRQAQKMEALGRLAGGIAHDFNNLLTVLRISTQMLERQLHPEDPLAEHVRNIWDTSERATRLTRQLLSFSRREIIEPRVLNLNQVVRNLSRMLQRILGEDVQLMTELADDLWPIQADLSQIDQVIVNLAVNARDAMPGGGTLTIETANVVLDEAFAALHVEVQAGEHVLLAVRDAGMGIDDEVKARIFEPFFTTKDRGQGTGLGLATVFGIVKQNGGHIEVHSEVGQGTTFKIYLPRTTGPAPLGDVRRPVSDLEPQLLPPEPRYQGSETVLLVEDDASVRELAVRVLASCGYRLLAASDGLQALQIGHSHRDDPIHLLLTDVVLPQMSGKELAEQLRAGRPEMRVMYMSGYTDDAMARHGVLAPGVSFLSKPFTVQDLTRRVREVLDEPAGM